MKSRDLVNWEFVSIPDFPNDSQWENAVYVKGDRAYYCCRQYSRNNTAFLTYYDLLKKTWHEPVWVYETQTGSSYIRLITGSSNTKLVFRNDISGNLEFIDYTK